MSRVVATVGAIPGAGATTVVTALGSALAEQRSHVALVDASAEGSRIADVLPLDGGGEVADALRRRADLADVQADGPHGLRAFPAAPETNWTAVRPGAVATAYDRLRDRFDLVLVDCGSDLTPASAAWIGYADELLVVSCPDVDDATEQTAALGDAFDVPVRGIVENRVVPDERAAALEALETSQHRALGVLPEDPTVDAAATECRSVLVHEPDSQIASCVWEFARRVRESDHEEPVLPDAWSGLDAGSGAAASDGGATADDGGATADDGGATTDDGGATANDGGEAAEGASATADGTAETASTQAATPDGGTGTAASSSASVDSEASDATSDPTSPARSGSDASVTSEDDPGDADTGASSDGATSDDAGSAFEWSSSDDLDGDDGGTTSDDGRATGDDSGLSGGAGVGGESDDPDDSAADETGAPSLGTDAGTDHASSAERGTSERESSERGSSERGSADRGSVADGGLQSSDQDGGTGSIDDADEEETTISDEEIEQAFKETMQQAKAERDAGAEEDADDGEGDEDDDSVLGGFMGN